MLGSGWHDVGEWECHWTHILKLQSLTPWQWLGGRTEDENSGWRPKAGRSGQNVQPACGQTNICDCHDFCFSLAAPAVQWGGYFVQSCRPFRYAKIWIAVISGYLLFLAHTLPCIHKHSPTHTGDILLQRIQAGVKLLTGRRVGLWVFWDPRDDED